MKNAITQYRGLPIEEKAFGEGLASTGNAGKLTSRKPNPTESYPLKLLVETGALGALLIGAILIWTLLYFARTAWEAPDPLLKGAGAAGIGLFAESLIYPTLEVQLLALTWWLLVVVCLTGSRKARAGPRPDRSIEAAPDLLGAPVERQVQVGRAADPSS